MALADRLEAFCKVLESARRCDNKSISVWSGDPEVVAEAVSVLRIAASQPDREAVAAETSFGWVIEAGWTPASAPEYWCGTEGEGDGLLHHWNKDSFRAIRFARKIDAERIARCIVDGVSEQPLAWQDVTRVVEYGWNAAPSVAVAETDADAPGDAKDGGFARNQVIPHDVVGVKMTEDGMMFQTRNGGLRKPTDDERAGMRPSDTTLSAEGMREAVRRQLPPAR